MMVQALEDVGDLPTDVQDTPIPDEPSCSQPQRKHKPKRKQRIETKVSPTETNIEEHVPTTSNDPLPGGEDKMKLKGLMDLCTNLSNKVLDLESEVIEMKSSHKAKIKELESRVEKLEEQNKSLTNELKSFNTKVESLTINETVMDKEKSSKQGRKITDIDVDAEVNLENVYNLDMAHEETILTKPKAKGVTMQEPSEFRITLPSQAKDKGKGLMVELEMPLTRKDQIALDKEVARGLEFGWNADMKDNIDWNEVVEHVQSRQSDAVRKYQALKRKLVSVAQARKNMMIYLKNMVGYKMEYFKGMSYERIKPIFEMEYNKNSYPNLPEFEKKAKIWLTRSHQWKELKGQGLKGLGAGPPVRPSEPVPFTQETPSSAFVKDNIDVLRTMIKELDQQTKSKATPKKLAYDESEGGGLSEEARDMTKKLSHESFGTSKARAKNRSSGKNQRNLSHGKALSQPRRSKRAKLPRNIIKYDENKDLEDHLSILSATAEHEEWPMPVWCKMFRQTLGGVESKVPGRVLATKKTPKEILAMESVSFPPPSPLLGTPEKQNLGKFCDYHGDRGHNTNDCYHLKRQIEDVVPSRKLDHLVKDIYWRNQRGMGLGKRHAKVMNMTTTERNRKRPHETSDTLSPRCRKKLDEILRAHADVFAWATTAATTVPRMMERVLADQKGQNVEVYLKELMVKSKSEQSLLLDVQETLDKLHRVNIKTEPSRCTFGMEEGKFLGYVITKERIKADLEKVQVILRSLTPENPNQVRSLSLRLVSIGRAESDAEASQALQNEKTITPRSCRLYLRRQMGKEGLGARIIMVSPDKNISSYAIRLNFNAPEENMDYEVLLAGLWSPQEKVLNQGRYANRTRYNQAGIPQPDSIDGYQNKTIGGNQRREAKGRSRQSNGR
nr:RNA-directed DNA polymerase like [Tanacetum cinerariifolium]